jgi:transposase
MPVPFLSTLELGQFVRPVEPVSRIDKSRAVSSVYFFVNNKAMGKTLNYVGIDISKLTFDVAVSNGQGKYLHHKFSNDIAGFESFHQYLDSRSDCCVMEASGPYYLNLAFYLSSKDIAVSVVNPLVIRRFSQMRLLRSKTDKKDAVMIAEYGKTERPGHWDKEADYVLELKQMQAYSDLLNKNRTALMRQMGAFDASPVQNKVVLRSCRAQIKSMEKQLELISEAMRGIVETHHRQQHEQLQSIPGIGPKTSMTLIVLSGGFSKFENSKQLCSYVGLSPRIFESGTSVRGKARICKMGMSKIRAMLYVCAWTAKRCNKACRELYERLLAKGKPKKLALIAVANKLLKQAFSIAVNKTTYTENNINITCF